MRSTARTVLTTLGLFAATTAIGCTAAARVTTDFDPAPFGRLAIVVEAGHPSMASGPSFRPQRDSLETRLITALTARGYGVYRAFGDSPATDAPQRPRNLGNAAASVLGRSQSVAAVLVVGLSCNFLTVSAPAGEGASGKRATAQVRLGYEAIADARLVSVADHRTVWTVTKSEQPRSSHVGCTLPGVVDSIANALPVYPRS